MKQLSSAKITKTVKEMCIFAAHNLPADILAAIKTAAKKETGLPAKILNLCVKNAEIAKKELIPLCQDTGTAIIFAEVGDKLFIDGSLEEALQLGVKQGYEEGYLRKSIVADPLFTRANTKDNTPAIVHINFCKGDKLKLTLLLKGAGAENMSALKMFAPCSDIADIKKFILHTVKSAGAKACPPLVIGVGIGGNFEQCPLLAKKALTRAAGKNNKDKRYAVLEQELLAAINALNIGPQGLGGKTTALAVNIEFAPCHMASLPVAVNIGCHSNRHITKTL
jgi:fumarate hydratase subunit alpha